MPESGNTSKFNPAKSFIYFQKIVQKSGPAASASYMLVASVLILTLLGWYVDNVKETSPVGVLLGLGLGLLLGFYHLARTIWSGKKWDSSFMVQLPLWGYSVCLRTYYPNTNGNCFLKYKSKNFFTNPIISSSYFLLLFSSCRRHRHLSSYPSIPSYLHFSSKLYAIF